MLQNSVILHFPVILQFSVISWTVDGRYTCVAGLNVPGQAQTQDHSFCPSDQWMVSQAVSLDWASIISTAPQRQLFLGYDGHI